MLREGLLKLTVSDPHGREQILGLTTPGQVLGFDSLTDENHTYSAETRHARVGCASCGTRDMLRVLEQNPQAAMRTVAILNRELADAQRLIRLLGQKSAAEKTASLLLISQRPRTGRARNRRCR